MEHPYQDLILLKINELRATGLSSEQLNLVEGIKKLVVNDYLPPLVPCDLLDHLSMATTNSHKQRKQNESS